MRIKSAVILAFLFGIAARAQATPISPTPIAVTPSTVTVAWGLSGPSTGYVLEASTSGAFSTLVASSHTYDSNFSTLSVSGLNPNTTYFLRVGELSGGSTSYAIVTPTPTITLTQFVNNGLFVQTTSATIKV